MIDTALSAPVALSRPGVVVEIDTHANWGGGQYQVLALTHGLVARGVRVVLIAHEAGELARRARALDLPVGALPRRLASRWHPGGGGFVTRQGADDGIALYHAHDSRALTLALRARRLVDAPVVLSRRVATPFGRNPVSRFKHSPRRLHTVIATSRPVATLVCASGFPTTRTHVVESGTDIAAFAAKVPDGALREWAAGRPLVGSVGRLVPKKNWALLVRVAARLAREGHDLRWVVLGDGPDRESLARLASQLGVADRVRIDTTTRDAERVVKALDLLFHPSRREGSAAIVRAAMFGRVPVVAASCPAVADAIEGHGVLVDPDDERAAAAAIATLLADSPRRLALAEGAFAVAHARFRVESMVDGTLAIYARLLAEPVR